MKEIKKIAKDSEKRFHYNYLRKERAMGLAYTEADTHYEYAFIAGFRTAREMSACIAESYEPDDTDGKLSGMIKKIGESESDPPVLDILRKEQDRITLGNLSSALNFEEVLVDITHWACRYGVKILEVKISDADWLALKKYHNPRAVNKDPNTIVIQGAAAWLRVRRAGKFEVNNERD